MKWFTFRQNNSGGHFDKSMPLTMFVEAPTPRVANARAEDLGVYFDGCDSGRDCSCCGDRWYPVDDHDAEDWRPEIERSIFGFEERTAGFWHVPLVGDVEKQP